MAGSWEDSKQKRDGRAHSLVRGVANLLPDKLVLPLRGLVLGVGCNAGHDERHCESAFQAALER